MTLPSAERARVAQHIVSVSGGKDSTATYLLAMESGRPFRAVFADTGNEHEWTYDYVRTLHLKTGGPQVEEVRADFTVDFARKREYVLNKWPGKGVPDDVVQRAAKVLEKTSGNPYLDLCMWKGRFPSRMAQFCTEELKTMPIIDQVILPAMRNGPVLQWLGIRADESANRAKQPRFNRHDSGSYLWRPIFAWTVSDVWAMHEKHGLKRNPLYLNGMGRVGCMPCINCNAGEFAAISSRFPEHLKRIEEWQHLVGQASKRGRSTFFKINDAHTGEIDFGGGGGCSNDLALCEREAA